MVRVDFEYKPTPVLDRLLANLGDDGRRKLERAGAESAAVATRSWLLRLAADRHATAEKLKATPTGVIRSAAQNTRAEEDQGEHYVAVPHPLFRRAFRDVTIAPRKAGALAIPMARASYGRGPRTMGQLFVWSRKRGTAGKGDKGAAFLARSVGKGKNARLELLYLLWRGRIVQKKDSTLLPGRATLGEAAGKGVRMALGRVLKAVKTSGGKV